MLERVQVRLDVLRLARAQVLGLGLVRGAAAAVAVQQRRTTLTVVILTHILAF